MLVNQRDLAPATYRVTTPDVDETLPNLIRTYLDQENWKQVLKTNKVSQFSRLR